MRLGLRQVRGLSNVDAVAIVLARAGAPAASLVQIAEADGFRASMGLARREPGSAKNVTFITLEDETGVANLVVWEQVYEKHRGTVLTSSMLGVVGRILQREGDVVHVVAYKLIDLSSELSSIGGRDAPFPLPHGRGDEIHRGPSTPDPRGPAPGRIPALRRKTRDFH